MTPSEIAARSSERLELLLEQVLGAHGRGLQEKARSVQGQLPLHVLRRLRWVDSTCSRVAQEGAAAHDLEGFEVAVDELVRYLETLPPPRGLNEHSPPEVAQRGTGPGLWLKVVVAAATLALAVTAYKNLRDTSVPEASASLHTATAEGTVAAPTGDEQAEPTIASPPPTPPIPVTPPTASAKPTPSTVVPTLPAASPVVMGEQEHAPKAESRAGTQQTRGTTELERARTDVAQHVWGRIRDGITLKLGDPQVKDLGGGKHEVLVRVGWRIEPEPIVQTLNQYFWQYSKLPIAAGLADFDERKHPRDLGVIIERLANEYERQKLPFSRDLFDDLVRTQAQIRVSAGGHTGQLTIASGRYCFLSCERVGDSQFQIHFDNSARPDGLLFHAPWGEQNPVSLGTFSDSELASLGPLAVAVEFVDVQLPRR